MPTERKKKTTKEENAKNNSKKNTIKKPRNSTSNTKSKKESKSLLGLKDLMEDTSPEKVVGCYVRVSTDAQAEQGYSIPDQTAKLQAFCTVKGWENAKFYTDPGFSGSNLNRPAMQEMISDAMEGKLKAVVVFKLDRLSRSQKDTLYLIEDVFLPNEVDFVSISEALDTTTPYGRAMIGILSVFAQLERENIYMRTRIGMMGRVSAGYWRGGGNVPFGYDYDKTSKSLIPNADAPKVPQAYDLYIKGYSCQKIADMLGLSSEQLVRNILTKRTYCGYINYKGKDYKGFHEPLIDEERFMLVAAEMERRGKENLAVCGNNKYYLLTGLVFCGDCGARMRYMKWGKYIRIVCYSHTCKKNMVKDPDCPNKGVRADELEKVVISKLFDIGTDISLDDFDDTHVPASAAEILTNRIDELKESLRRLYGLYADIGDPMVYERIEDVRGQLHVLQRQLASEETQKLKEEHINYVREKIQTIGDLWPHLTPMERQTLVRDCVEKVILHHNGRVEVYYTFHTEKDSKILKRKGA